MKTFNLFLSLLLLRIDQTSAGTTTFGKYFITTVPIMEYSDNIRIQDIVFLFCTHYSNIMEVHVYEKTKRSSVLLSRDNPRVMKDSIATRQMTDLSYNSRNYRFNAAEDFGLTTMTFSGDSTASFTVLPVEGWGKSYYVFTLSESPSIQIVTDETVIILVTFQFEDPSSRWSFQNVTYRDGMTMELNLDKWITFPIQNCTRFHDDVHHSFTGTKLLGDKKFGVVSGNCYTATKTYHCYNTTQLYNRTTADTALEMLLPIETYGKTFIVPVFAGRTIPGSYSMTSAEADTDLHVHKGQNVTKLRLQAAGNTITQRLTRVTYINSTKGIHVIFIWHSRCGVDPDRSDQELGDVAITSIIPMSLFYYSYMWKTADSNDDVRDDQHYFTIVYKAVIGERIDLLMEQGYNLIFSASVPVLQGWSITSYHLQKSDYVYRPTHLLSPNKRPFGCYVYGFRLSQGFIHPAGYISSPINDKCTKTLASMTPGDLVDNDCDRMIDEEIENQRDDDNDAEIDEDLFYLTDEERKKIMEAIKKEELELGIVHGGWGEWGEWQCTANCPNRTMTRNRLCNRPTPANGGRSCPKSDSKDFKIGDCYKGQICAEDCPDFEWDINCLGSCSMCQEPCDKKTGVCHKCRKGYKSPSTGCNIPCGFNEFGKNCRGNCTAKCGGDCYERRNGDCPVHGAWSRWSPWQCTSNCKDSRQVRERECNNPAPALGGNYCPDSDINFRNHTCYANVTCQHDCPVYRWDMNCSETCENCQDDCDKYNGSCGRCNKGFKLPERACMTVCSPNEFGENCEGDCIAKCGDNCFDRIEGICSVHGGWSDWEAWQCTSNCNENQEMRKRTCTKPRPEKDGRNCEGDDTERKDSDCYKGIICSEECPLYMWDMNCSKSCHNCIDDCNKLTGSCLSCKKGYKFPDIGCTKPCDEFEFGENCLGDCRIKCGDDCFERVEGTCPVHGEWGLWTEWKCSNCPDKRMFRKRVCDNPPPNKGGDPCRGLWEEFRNSTCYRDMIYCYDDCPPKTWDLNCSKSCINCLDECNKYDGTCKGCRAGFKHPEASCSKPCDTNEFGDNCSGNCMVKCGEDCEDRVLGTCPVYGTWQEWQQWQCTHSCNETRKIRYRICQPPQGRELLPKSCKNDNFELAPSNCYEGKGCPSDCPEFHWGTSCVHCKKCKYDCDKFNGSCRKCLPGFQRPESGCQKECESMFYGQDCQESCEKKCGQDCANRVSGDCPESKTYLWGLLLLIFPILIFCAIPKSRGSSGSKTHADDVSSVSKAEDSRASSMMSAYTVERN